MHFACVVLAFLLYYITQVIVVLQHCACPKNGHSDKCGCDCTELHCDFHSTEQHSKATSIAPFLTVRFLIQQTLNCFLPVSIQALRIPNSHAPE